MLRETQETLTSQPLKLLNGVTVAGTPHSPPHGLEPELLKLEHMTCHVGAMNHTVQLKLKDLLS